MKTIDLFVTKDENVATNIPKEYSKRTDLAKLRTPYMTLTSYDENGEYNGFDIELMDINLEKGYAEFRVDTDLKTFTIPYTDDPIVVFDEHDPGVEYHIFEKTVQYEINQDIKEGGLYKFQDTVTNDWFLAVVQCVGTYQVTLNKFDIMRDKTFSPTLYTLCQQPDIFGITTTDNRFCIEKFKNYKVTELFDLTTAFGDNDKDDEEEEEE